MPEQDDCVQDSPMKDSLLEEPSTLESALKRNWDFGLTIATVVLLGGIGVQSFLGTLYGWWAEGTPGWEQVGHAQFLDVMNALAAPQIVLLIVVMGLCVPKRLFSRTLLVAISAAMLLAGLAAWALTDSLATGLALYLALSALIQIAVVVMTAVGARGLLYLTEGRLTKIGSGLLHLGFIVFAFVVVALQRSALMLPTFWVATGLSLIGSVLSFYADRFVARPTRRIESERNFAEE